MQRPSTFGDRIAPPAETLYAGDPLGVETIAPSPKHRLPAESSVPSPRKTIIESAAMLVRSDLPSVSTPTTSAPGRAFTHATSSLIAGSARGFLTLATMNRRIEFSIVDFELRIANASH